MEPKMGGFSDYYDAALNYSLVMCFFLKVHQIAADCLAPGNVLVVLHIIASPMWLTRRNFRKIDAAFMIFRAVLETDGARLCFNKAVDKLGPVYGTLLIFAVSMAFQSDLVWSLRLRLRLWSPLFEILICAAACFSLPRVISMLFFMRAIGTPTNMYVAECYLSRMISNAQRLIEDLVLTQEPTRDLQSIERFLRAAKPVGAFRQMCLSASTDKDLLRILMETRNPCMLEIVNPNVITHEANLVAGAVPKLYLRRTAHFPWFRLVSHNGRPHSENEQYIIDFRNDVFRDRRSAHLYAATRNLARFTDTHLVLAAGPHTSRLPLELFWALYWFLY